MRKRKETSAIVVHCSATPEGRDHSVADIRSWHKARGFEDVGYHYVVGLDGTVSVGRREDLEGAHCPDAGMNRKSIGICYIGGMDRENRQPKDTRTPGQREGLERLVVSLARKYGIPKGRIYGHRDFAAKACPSFDVGAWVRGIVIACLVVFVGACGRKVVSTGSTVTSVQESIGRHSDSVGVVSRLREFVMMSDSVYVRERGDSVFRDVVKWRVLKVRSGDTVRVVERDTVFVREQIREEVLPLEQKRGWGVGWVVSFLIAIVLVVVIAIGMRMRGCGFVG